jgi:hypothetical protein
MSTRDVGESEEAENLRIGGLAKAVMIFIKKGYTLEEWLRSLVSGELRRQLP